MKTHGSGPCPSRRPPAGPRPRERLVVSPYAKRGYVSHQLYDHTSILRFIEAKFRVPALTARDANAAIPLDFFDFASAPRLDLPSLPEATVDPDGLAYCKQAYPKQ